MTGEHSLFNVYQPRPLILIISGPSAVGKDAVLNGLKQRRDLPLYFVVTATTRERREGEREGVDYFFVSSETFKKMIEHDELIEHALVYGENKGVPKAQINQALHSGKDVVLRVDVQGTMAIKSLFPNTVTVFLLPENEPTWLRHFTRRNSETEDALQVRIQTARDELKRVHEFDYMVVNAEGKLDETIATIEAILRAEHHRVHPK